MSGEVVTIAAFARLAQIPEITVTDEPALRGAVVRVGRSDAHTTLGFEALHQ